MIKKMVTQDQYGNKIYRYTSSDIVIDLDTGRTVKQDIERILAALGAKTGTAKPGGDDELKIDAATIGGKTLDELMLKDTYDTFSKEIAKELSDKAPIDSPTFTGTPTVPSIEQLGDGSEKVANTDYVDRSVEELKDIVVDALEKYAKKEHMHSASDIIAGEFAVTNVRAKDSTDYGSSRVRNIMILSDTVPAALPNGSIACVYEE